MRYPERSFVERLIAERHWGKGESLRAIERSLGAGNGVVSRWCQHYGIAVRSRAVQVRLCDSKGLIARPRGETHWAFGLRRTDRIEPMRANNPMFKPGSRDKATASVSAWYRKNLTPAEQRAAALFPDAVMQHPVGPYALDVAFLRARVDLELDGKGHWSASRKAHDLKRDRWLIGQGWRVVRIAQRHISRPAHLIAVLEQLVPDLKVSGFTPDQAVGGRIYEYGVLVRDAQHPAGRKL